MKAFSAYKKVKRKVRNDSQGFSHGMPASKEENSRDEMQDIKMEHIIKKRYPAVYSNDSREAGVCRFEQGKE